MKKLKHGVFWPPFIVLVGSAVYSLVDTEGFLYYTKLINDWILIKFGWLYAVSVVSFLLICIGIYFSPISKIRIGGKSAKPILTKWRWFAITLCTTIAIGILFWGSAEPLYHLHVPPDSLGLTANSPESASFAMSTMYMHWTFVPYSIYTLAGLLFALVYYNLKQPFSLGSMLYPLIGERAHGGVGRVIDSICLFSLVAGMAASLGAGILTIFGGLEALTGISKTPFVLFSIAFTIVITFIVSAASGLLKGIRILSNINIQFFMLFALFVVLFGPTVYIFKHGGSAFVEYIVSFFDRSLFPLTHKGDTWANDWTSFYWANWLAWTPITAVFLGRLSLGYTVRDFIHFNLIFPALFGCLWMMIFSGTAIHMDTSIAGSPLFNVLQNQGPEYVVFSVFERLPWFKLTSGLFFIVAFLSYVTAADSNTSAMSGISSSGISPNSPEPSLWIKIIWGVVVGVIAVVMVTYAGIDGIKMASNLGGFPALFLVILIAIGMIKLIIQREKYFEHYKESD